MAPPPGAQIIGSANRLEAAFLLAGLSGVAAVFLPFSSGISPWMIFGESLSEGNLNIIVAATFFLPIPISVLSLILLLMGRLPRALWITAFSLASAAVLAWLIYMSTLNFALSTAMGGADPLSAILLAIPFVTVVMSPALAGALILRTRIRRGLPVSVSAIAAMEIAVIGVVAPILVLVSLGPAKVWNVGAYIAIFALAVYIAHLIFALRSHRLGVDQSSVQS